MSSWGTSPTVPYGDALRPRLTSSTVPDVVRASPASTASRLLLPAPLAPITATSSPGATLRLTPSSTRLPPRTATTSVATRRGPDSGEPGCWALDGLLGWVLGGWVTVMRETLSTGPSPRLPCGFRVVRPPQGRRPAAPQPAEATARQRAA